MCWRTTHSVAAFWDCQAWSNCLAINWSCSGSAVASIARLILSISNCWAIVIEIPSPMMTPQNVIIYRSSTKKIWSQMQRIGFHVSRFGPNKMSKSCATNQALVISTDSPLKRKARAIPVWCTTAGRNIEISPRLLPRRPTTTWAPPLLWWALDVWFWVAIFCLRPKQNSRMLLMSHQAWVQTDWTIKPPEHRQTFRSIQRSRGTERQSGSNIKRKRSVVVLTKMPEAIRQIAITNELKVNAGVPLPERFRSHDRSKMYRRKQILSRKGRDAHWKLLVWGTDWCPLGDLANVIARTDAAPPCRYLGLRHWTQKHFRAAA